MTVSLPARLRSSPATMLGLSSRTERLGNPGGSNDQAREFRRLIGRRRRLEVADGAQLWLR
jgi:hypothetical protein